MIAKEVQNGLQNSSWIRKMFVEGNALKAIYGEENVYDYSIGNPYFEPPQSVIDNLKKLVNSGIAGTHRYMDNAGFKSTREKVAASVNKGTEVPLSYENIMMTVGAAGGLNVLLRTILDPGQEVIILAPYFAEYFFYIRNNNGVPVTVKCTEGTFEPDLKVLEAHITEKTRAILLNSPNNPTGVIYSEALLKDMAAMLESCEKHFGTEICVIADEPYKALLYDGAVVPNVLNIFKNAVIVNSYSKSLGLAGERIGYIAVNSRMDEPKLLMDGLAFCNRTLGFVNAPALWQKAVEDSVDATVEISEYAKRRDLLYNHLVSLGFEVNKPQGAFYLFPKALIEDDIAFVEAAKKHNLLFVPGTGFGYPGYVRLSYCVDIKMIERSLPAFTKLAEEFKK
jgi:aspartate aminotransferase